ncbi:MAG: MarR family transcriptional regulator [Alphaproteobacteria bacterium]|nr:MarR family transcriptional regulator [Alphaproteobacteria bacterium]
MSNPNALSFETTLRVRDTCLCLHLQRAARAVARRFDEALRSLDLTNGQFSLLMSLNRPEPAAMSGVAALLAMDRTTLTAALKPLQRRGLVDIAVDPADRRSRKLTLTDAGRTLLTAALPIWEREHMLIDAEMPDLAPEQLRERLRCFA